MNKLQLDFKIEKENLIRKKKEMQKEIDFMYEEQNIKELELSRIKKNLKEREIEIKELKDNLNCQLSNVSEEYTTEMK